MEGEKYKKVFIPSKPGDPGYADLESHGISDFVMEKLPGEALVMFNDAARQSMKWLTEYSNCRATIVSILKSRKNAALLAQEMPANQAAQHGRD